MMLTRKIIIGLLSLTLIGGIGSLTQEASASTWHRSTITLPRNGWWSTVNRRATSNRAATNVRNPNYKVYSSVSYANGTHATGVQGHAAKSSTTKYHRHNTSGSNIRARFRSAYINQRTNRINLGWRP